MSGDVQGNVENLNVGEVNLKKNPEFVRAKGLFAVKKKKKEIEEL